MDISPALHSPKMQYCQHVSKKKKNTVSMWNVLPRFKHVNELH